jgi:hypothetical protein
MSRLFLVAILAVGSACTPVGSPSSPSPSAPVAPVLVLPHDQLDATYVLPGAAIEVDGLAHLWVVAFYAAEGAAPQVMHLTSMDGIRWVAGASSAAFRGDVGLDTIGPVPSSVIVDADGTWHLFGSGRTADRERPIIWSAAARSPDGPWELNEEPVLQPEGEGWDGLVTDHPSVVHTADGWMMAYGGAGAPDSNRSRIGFARPPDGVAWERVPATLEGADDATALGPSACGINARSMLEPQLRATDGGLRLHFGAMRTGTDVMVIGAAASEDGVAWRCAESGPVLEPSDFPGSSDVHSYLAMTIGGRELLLVEVLGPGAESSDLWLAVP